MDPEQPVPGLGHHAPIAELSDEAIDAFVANGRARPAPPAADRAAPAGRRAGPPVPDNGALAQLDVALVLSSIGTPMMPELGEEVPGDLDRIAEAMSPGRPTAATSTSPSGPATSTRSSPPTPAPRLAGVKRRWDPDGASSPTTRSHSTRRPEPPAPRGGFGKTRRARAARLAGWGTGGDPIVVYFTHYGVLVTRGKGGRFEIRESRGTPAGPRSRTLASFKELDATRRSRRPTPAPGPRSIQAELRRAAPAGRGADRADRRRPPPPGSC